MEQNKSLNKWTILEIKWLEEQSWRGWFGKLCLSNSLSLKEKFEKDLLRVEDRGDGRWGCFFCHVRRFNDYFCYDAHDS